MVAAEAAYRSNKIRDDFQSSQGWFSGRARRGRKARQLEIALEQPLTPIVLPRQREAEAAPVRLPEPANEPANDRHGAHAA
jgi:hypothetical protein